MPTTTGRKRDPWEYFFFRNLRRPDVPQQHCTSHLRQMEKICFFNHQRRRRRWVSGVILMQLHRRRRMMMMMRSSERYDKRTTQKLWRKKQFNACFSLLSLYDARTPLSYLGRWNAMMHFECILSCSMGVSFWWIDTGDLTVVEVQETLFARWPLLNDNGVRPTKLSVWTAFSLSCSFWHMLPSE